MYNMDKLFEAVVARGHVCVGLDTALEYLPDFQPPAKPAEAASASDAPSASEAAASILAFNKAIIDATIDIAACFKVQIAYYEEMGIAGLDCYARTLSYLREKGALIIADIKRSDIADTASRYARAHFSGDFEADFVTLNPYLGMDSLEPWLHWADNKGKGAFVLMRTSNKGRHDFQLQNLEGGEASPPLAPEPLRNFTKREEPSSRSVSYATPPPGGDAPKPPRLLCDVVGERLTELTAARLGKHSYGAFGAVVGVDSQSPTEREAAIAIRARYPNLFFLIPGYGTQGGGAEDAALLLREGNGGVVNASRSILLAWRNSVQGAASDSDIAKADLSFAAEAARKATIEMRDAILAACGRTACGPTS